MRRRMSDDRGGEVPDRVSAVWRPSRGAVLARSPGRGPEDWGGIGPETSTAASPRTSGGASRSRKPGGAAATTWRSPPPRREPSTQATTPARPGRAGSPAEAAWRGAGEGEGTVRDRRARDGETPGQLESGLVALVTDAQQDAGIRRGDGRDLEA